MENISVIGAGSWGTTIAKLLGEKGYNVKLWVYEKELVEKINNTNENKQYLAGVILPKTIKATNSLEESASDSNVIITAIPSQFLRNIAKNFSGYVKKDTIIVNLAKGIEQGTYKRMSEVIEEEIPDVKVIALSGPNHAEEVSKKMPTATVIASKDKDCLQTVKNILTTDYFKIYPHDDIIGTEICGAIKNITAIASGVVDGLGFGDNSKGSIITLGLTEMNMFGRYFGAKRATFYGLTGVGDLVATCTSKHSRNRFVGEKMAEGKHLEEIKKEMHGMVAEGIVTTKVVYEFSKKNEMKMPLTTQVYNVLYEKKDLKTAIKDLIKLI